MKPALYSEFLEIPADNKLLKGELLLPENVESVVLFSSINGSSRFSSKNRMVAELLRECSIGSLLFDLITPEEDLNHENRMNIPFLTKRLILATEFIQSYPVTDELRVGYFGAGMGSAPAIIAASDFGYLIKAVVCRGGELELAIPFLKDLKAPALLLTAGEDKQKTEIIHQASKELKSPGQVRIMEGASDSFQEPGKAEEVAETALLWFKKYLNEK